MSAENQLAIVEGQFDDAPCETAIRAVDDQQDPRAGRYFIDDEHLLSWSDESSEDDDGDELNEDDFEDVRADDEDWEVAERDFTKQYNRLRQHVAVRTGNAQGTPSSINRAAVVAPLPAVNKPRSLNAVPAHAKDKTTNQLAVLSKYSSRIAKIDQPYVMGASVNRKGPSSYANAKDKSDRATSEQVLDPRTRIILFKMIGRELIQEVNGCVSTGKEANVYHALTPTSTHIALKIYKTSILVFKDRDRYVTGEYRFRRGYSRRNPRKMVRLWAEKEMRNLKRLVSAGIPCPEPIEVRENILVMGFLGDEEGWASPRLKDADIPSALYPALYEELILNVRKMYHTCKLVHADLSEYNILFHGGHLCIIDVSQSVEHDHPSAFDFLRSDIKNIEDFFERFGVKCLGLRRCFDFITRVHVVEEGQDEGSALKHWLAEADKEQQSPPSMDGSTNNIISLSNTSATHEDNIFLQSYIPRTLNEVYDAERDVEVLTKGDGKNLIYAETIGLTHPTSGVSQEGEVRPHVRFKGEGSSEDGGLVDEGEYTSDSEEEGSGEPEAAEVSKDTFDPRTPRGHRHEDREAKKERKKAVKTEAREKRKTKIPKAEKKRKTKSSRAH
ncbi:RIO1 family-domain-containing protein [Suillus subaureus]|uniref:Serine/threonine-protein kinase RIO1 n=1 Tax=Suillus subaureus TaxID=48587 RepID=A0A9P7EID8_9AGAM|nr:RIO1 family-domain-containing protein [Suillus subaureus]KAG1822736.1 RIO1 family-domain-containing protein [Suillus subaureus]